ncbi:MAG: hypothetical protein II839_07375 [Kiritimatiellae bacterium]|nr:hypothetical protein [Kiritimatiellia bacterium]
MTDETENTAVPETQAPAEPAPVPETPAPAPEPAPAPAPEEKKRARTGLFDKVALAPFYLFALVVGWGVASLFAGDGFACPSWLRCLALWVFFLGAVWSVVFRDRVARPAGYVAGCVGLFLVVALFMPHGTTEERTARRMLDATVAEWRAEGYDVSVASFSTERQDDGSYLGTALLRSGDQVLQFDLTARVETANGYAIKVEGLKPEENPRLAHIRELADRLPPPDAEEEKPAAEEKPADAAK